jgi:hypothetical protein
MRLTPEDAGAPAGSALQTLAALASPEGRRWVVWGLFALVLLGAFAAIYHPVGIPMLVQNAKNPGATIGVNGLAGRRPRLLPRTDSVL